MKRKLSSVEKLAREIDRWMKRLEPRLPEISRDELHLILWGMLRQKHGGELHFLLRRKKDGGYVF